MTTSEETQEIRRLAVEFYLMRDVVKAFAVPNREHLHDTVFAELERLGTELQARGATIGTLPPENMFDSPRPLVVLPNGAAIAPEHNRLDIEHRVSALIEADHSR